jgi:hypothetical protein
LFLVFDHFKDGSALTVLFAKAKVFLVEPKFRKFELSQLVLAIVAPAGRGKSATISRFGKRLFSGPFYILAVVNVVSNT